MHPFILSTYGLTYVSSCLKFTLFLLNFVLWLCGGLLMGIGFYAFVDKWQVIGLMKLETLYDVALNTSPVVIMAGGILFIVSFAGCLGALHENTCLLKFYSFCLWVLFLSAIDLAILSLVFLRNIRFFEKSFTDKIIATYRENTELQNVIDLVQYNLNCCGLSDEGYLDWGKNEYFNCSSLSVDSCGVPYSCCLNATDASGLTDIMCGYRVQQHPIPVASEKIWTSGCIGIIRAWLEWNHRLIAEVGLGVALILLFVIYLVKTLEGQIYLQQTRWARFWAKTEAETKETDIDDGLDDEPFQE